MGCSVMLPSLWRKSVQIRNLNTVLWVVLLCGCAGKLDISNLELSSNVHEGCFSPTTTMDVYYYKNGFNQKYELLSPKAPWCSNDIFMESCQKVFPISKSGEIKNWLISGAPNYNVNGELIGSIGIHLDITNQKNLEKQKEELLNSLEKQNEQLNDYAHIVSHDLKSPLRSISALLSWTKEDFEEKLGEQSLVNLNLMQDKIEKMDKLISDILNYSSIENEGMNTELVDINVILNTIVNSIYIPEHIKVLVKQKLPTLKADATRMQQLFQNLISNAVNYIDKEKGLVEVDYTETSEFYIFSIKDNGVGIPEEYHEKIFKMFSTLGNYENSSGIGLNIVKKVVELYKGKIWIESEVGIGSTFFFSIAK